MLTSTIISPHLVVVDEPDQDLSRRQVSLLAKHGLNAVSSTELNDLSTPVGLVIASEPHLRGTTNCTDSFNFLSHPQESIAQLREEINARWGSQSPALLITSTVRPELIIEHPTSLLNGVPVISKGLGFTGRLLQAVDDALVTRVGFVNAIVHNVMNDLSCFDISKELLNSAIRSSDFNKQFHLSLEISTRAAQAFDWLRNFIPETAEQFELTVIDNNPTLTPVESEVSPPNSSGRIFAREYIQQQANADLVTKSVSAAYIELKNFLDTRAPYDAQICQLHDWDEYLKILEDKFLGIEKVVGGLR